MHAVDGYAYASTIARADPIAKMVFALVPLVLTLCYQGYSAGIATCVLMFFVTTHCGKITKMQYTKLLLAPASFLLLGVITIIFGRFDPAQSVLIGFGIGQYVYGISQASLSQGLYLVFRALGAVSCMYFLSLNTPMIDILSVLKKARIPGYVIALMELIYRYIFVLFDEAQSMRIAQQARLGYCDFQTSLRSVGTLIANLFLRAFQRCDRVHDALESRGYDGNYDSLTDTYEPKNSLYAWCAVIAAGITLLFLLEKNWEALWI